MKKINILTASILAVLICFASVTPGMIYALSEESTVESESQMVTEERSSNHENPGEDPIAAEEEEEEISGEDIVSDEIEEEYQEPLEDTGDSIKVESFEESIGQESTEENPMKESDPEESIGEIEKPEQSEEETLIQEEIYVETVVPETERPEQIEDAYGTDSIQANQELIKQQNIIDPEVIKENYRFWTVEKEPAFAKTDDFFYEEKTEQSKQVGSFKKNNVLYLLKEEGDWYYAESGATRGFIKKESVTDDLDANEIIKVYQALHEETRCTEMEEFKLERYAGVARALVPKEENSAFFYSYATVYNRVIQKTFVLPIQEDVYVYANKDLSSAKVGILSEHTIAYLILPVNKDWIYIESGDVRGFAERASVRLDDHVQEEVLEAGEESYKEAELLVDPKDNTAFYYTLYSVKEGVNAMENRRSLLEYASQFIGNPYVWGGTSLTNGADCSGFVQKIYKEYGYDLPRTSVQQSNYGTKIPVEDAAPGDLIFYAKDGTIFHVVIYAGDGKTIEAQTESTGIVTTNVEYGIAVWAVRILP